MNIGNIPLELLIAISLILNLVGIHMPLQKDKRIDGLITRIIRLNVVGTILMGSLFATTKVLHFNHRRLLATMLLLTMLHVTIVAVYSIFQLTINKVLDIVERHQTNG